MSKPYIVLLGFIVFVLGLLSLILKLCGMQFIFMKFLQDSLGSWTTLLYGIMCIGGLMVVFLSMESTKPIRKEN